MIQAGRSRIRIPLWPFYFFNLSDPSSNIIALMLTQFLTEISIKNFPGGKAWPERKADNLIPICEAVV
jgi:hypothetical protein